MIRLLLVLVTLAVPAQAETLRLAVTTSFHNSGLADVLLPAIKADTGIDVQLLTVGTGQALRLGAAGDVDAVLVHAQRAEEQFVADGHAPYRLPIMYNDFVILGPRDDPAAIAAAQTARAALAQIKSARSPFISRGDDSGTHKRELSLWVGGAPEANAWYHSTGSGMGAALNIAVAKRAYILTDRASWLNFGNRGDLAILFEGDPALLNQYAYLPITAQKRPHVNAQAAQHLADWLTSRRAEQLINSYRIGGQALFTWNAPR